jgi:hypothetical protein
MNLAQYSSTLIPYTIAQSFGRANASAGEEYNKASREVSLKLQQIRTRVTQSGNPVDISDLLPLHEPYTVYRADAEPFVAAINAAIAAFGVNNQEPTIKGAGVFQQRTVTAPDVSLTVGQVGPLMGEFVDPVGTRRNRYLMQATAGFNPNMKPGTLFRDVRGFWLAWLGKTELAEQFEYPGEAYEIGLG